MFVSPDDAVGATASRIEERDRLITNGENGYSLNGRRIAVCQHEASLAVDPRWPVFCKPRCKQEYVARGVSARTSATTCSATLPIFTKKDM